MVKPWCQAPVAAMFICLLLMVTPISASRVQIDEVSGTDNIEMRSSWGTQSCTRLEDNFHQQMNKLPAQTAATTRTQMRVMYRMWTVARTLRRAQSAECGWLAEIDPEALEPLRNVGGNSMRDGPCAPQAQEIMAGFEEMTQEEQFERFTRAMRVSVSPDCTVSDVEVVEETDDEEEMNIEEGDELVDQVTNELLMEDSSFLETSNQPLAVVLLLVGVIASAILYAIVLSLLCGVFQYALMFIISIIVCAFRSLVGYSDSIRECVDLALARFQSQMGKRLRVATCAIPVAYGTTVASAITMFGLSYALVPLAAR